MIKKKFPISMLTIRVQNNVEFSDIIVGPGVISCISNADSNRAMTGVVGIPRLSMGIKLVWAAALLADSGPATPSMAPLPNFSGVLLMFFSML